MKKILYFIIINFIFIHFAFNPIKSQQASCSDSCPYMPQWTLKDIVFPVNQYYNIGVRYFVRCGYCNGGYIREIRIDEFNVIKNGTATFPDSSSLFPAIYDAILSRLLVDFTNCQGLEFQPCPFGSDPALCPIFKIRFRTPKCWRMYFDEVDTNVKSYRVCWQDKCCIHEYFCTIWRVGTPPNHTDYLHRSRTVNIISDPDTCEPEYGYNCFDICNLYFVIKREDIVLIQPGTPRIMIPIEKEEKEIKSDFLFLNDNIKKQIVISSIDNNSIENIKLYDFLGREVQLNVFSKNLSHRERVIDYSSLKQGIYFIIIVVNNKITYIKNLYVI